MRNTIDKFYTDNYNLLVSAAKRRITQLKKSIEPESLVSSSYLYLVGKVDTITEEEIERLAFGFIYFELMRYNSQTNLKERINSMDLEFDISEYDVAIMMTMLKLARNANEPKDDNLLDAAAYLALADSVKDSARC